MEDTNGDNLSSEAPRGILSEMQRSNFLRDGRREQEEVLSLQPCLFGGHRWQPVRLDEERGLFGTLYFICQRCGAIVNYWEAEQTAWAENRQACA